MKILRIIALGVCLFAVCSCGKTIKNYRVYNDLIISFTEALGDRTLVSENLTKSDDGRIIERAEYTYKSDNPTDDMQNYLYYMLNHFDATFLGENRATIQSKDFEYAIMIDVANTDDTFTITITRPKMG